MRNRGGEILGAAGDALKFRLFWTFLTNTWERTGIRGLKGILRKDISRIESLRLHRAPASLGACCFIRGSHLSLAVVGV